MEKETGKAKKDPGTMTSGEKFLLLAGVILILLGVFVLVIYVFAQTERLEIVLMALSLIGVFELFGGLFVMAFLQRRSDSEATFDAEDQEWGAKVDDDQARAVRKLFRSNSRRLEEEIRSLSRRGGLFIFAGSFITIYSASLIVILGLWKAPAPSGPIGDVISHYVPTIIIAMLFQGLALFLFRQYSQTVEAIKVYHDVLAGTIRREVAVETALLLFLVEGSSDILKDISKKFSQEEKLPRLAPLTEKKTKRPDSEEHGKEALALLEKGISLLSNPIKK